MFDKHIHEKDKISLSSYNRCIGVHVPGIADIIRMYTSTGMLPPQVQVIPHESLDHDETFDTDISYRNPKESDISLQFYNFERASKEFMDDVKRLSKSKSSKVSSSNNDSNVTE